jgi:recombination protein RecT
MGKDLAARVGDRTQQAGYAAPDTGGEVATREENAPVRSLRQQIEDMHDHFQAAMPRGAEARQLVRDAQTLLRATPKLALCDPMTVLGGLMTFAQLGLRPGVLGHGWLIPFNKRRKVGDVWQDHHQAQIVIGYKGYVELVHRSAEILDMDGHAVHANDVFDVSYGLHKDLVHKPLRRGDRGPVEDYYAIIRYQNGGWNFWTMTKAQCVEWRDTFAMACKRDRAGKVMPGTGSGPWWDVAKGPDGMTGFDQQSIKTCFLQAQKWAPKGRDLVIRRAIEVDGGVRRDTDLEPDAMLDVEHPTPDVEHHDVVDGEVVTEQPAERERVTVQHQPTPAAAAPADTDVPPPPGPVGEQAEQGQHRRIMALLGRLLTGDTAAAKDAHRHAVFTALLRRPITTGADVKGAEADYVFDRLKAWQQDKTLAARVAAMAAGAAPTTAEDPAPAAGGEKLPDPGTVAWHDQQHPVLEHGRVVLARVDSTGACGICDEDRAGDVGDDYDQGDQDR